jgi:hypothetical protein
MNNNNFRKTSLCRNNFSPSLDHSHVKRPSPSGDAVFDRRNGGLGIMRGTAKSKCAAAGLSIWFAALILPAEKAWPEIPADSTDSGNGGSASTMPDEYSAAELGYRFLSTRDTIRGQLGETYRMLKKLEQKDALPAFSLTYVMRYPDGLVGSMRINSLPGFENVLDEIRSAHEFYAGLVESRSSRSLEAKYTADVSPACPPAGIVAGPVEMHRDGLLYLLVQGDRTFEAVSVDATVVVTFPGLSLPPIMGSFDGADIALEDSRSSCTVRLVAQGEDARSDMRTATEGLAGESR